MDVNSSQSSCEINTGIEKLGLSNESENVLSQLSEIAGGIGKIAVINETTASDANETNNVCEDTSKVDTGSCGLKPTSSSSSSGESSSSSSSSANEAANEPPAKCKRKRKRKRKRKTTTAYEPPRPFKARYKRIKLFEPSVLPKSHIRFDDTGALDVAISTYNVKPKVVKALPQNLSLNEDLRKSKCFPDGINKATVDDNILLIPENYIVVLKPRIIKGIIV